jgi:hypothetical protein
MQDSHVGDKTDFSQAAQMGLPEMRSGDIPEAEEERKVISLQGISA